MLIKSLDLTNFKQYRQQSIRFNEGLTGLVGLNGAGKSTIFDAITFALYGSTGDVNLKDLKNDHAAPRDPVEVTLEFVENNRNYKIVRSLRGANATSAAALYRIEEDGEIQSLAEKVSDVKKELFKVIKLDRNSFINSFFAKQKETAGLLDISAGERDKEIRRMLGLDRLDKLSKKIGESIKLLNLEVISLEGNIKSPEEIDTLKDELTTKLNEKIVVEGQVAELHIAVTQKTTQKSEAQANLDELRRIETIFNGIKNEITRLKTVEESTKASIASTEAEIRRLQMVAGEAAALAPQVQRLGAVEEELGVQNIMRQNLQTYENLQRARTELEETLATQHNRLMELSLRIEQSAGVEDTLALKQQLREQMLEGRAILENQLAGLRDRKTGETTSLQRIIEHKAVIEQRDATAPCPECKRELGEYKQELLARYEEEIAGHNSRIAVIENEAADIRRNLDEKAVEISQVESDIQSLHIAVNNLHMYLLERNNFQTSITTLENRVAQTGNEIDNVGPRDFNQEIFNLLTAEKSELQILNNQYQQMLGEAAMIEPARTRHHTLLEVESQTRDSLIARDLELAEIDFDPATVTTADALLREKDQELLKAIGVHNEARLNLQSLNADILNRQNNLNQCLASIKAYESAKQEVGLYENYRNIVDGFKDRVTSESLPKISYEADELFRNITRDRYNSLQIDPESFEIIVKREDKEVPLETLSGGEKDLAAVCLRIAISRHIVSMNGAGNLGFLALDEVFGSQDEGRRGELLNALQQISDKFSQVFIVSHNQDVQEAFPNRLIISKSGHYSVIHQMMANN